MMQRSFGRNAAFAGMAALALAGSPFLAATVPGDALAAPVRLDRACSHSTNSMQQLATIDNANDAKFQCLGLSLEGDRVTAFRLETHDFASNDRRAVVEQVKIAEFPLAVVESSHGAVLDGVPGHDAIILRGHFSRPADKAELVTVYLYNGFTSEYRSCRITLDKAPGAGWRLVNRLNQTVSRIIVRTREIPVIGMFGIANLEGACTQLDL
jgi:hypothetical protein